LRSDVRQRRWDDGGAQVRKKIKKNGAQGFEGKERNCRRCRENREVASHSLGRTGKNTRPEVYPKS